MIQIDDVSYDYPGKRALSHVSCTIAANTITALVGPNGAGKTTLLRCLSALDSPMRGKILIDGLDTDRFPRKIHEISSYLSDFFGLYDELTVEENLTFFAWSRNCPSSQIAELVERAIQRLQLSEFRKITAGKLSRGLRQRLAIAQTIIHNPKILFLDEPASGLDPEARFHLSKMLLSLQSEGMTLIVSSHILAELEDYSTHMLVIHDGKLVEQCALKDYHQKDNVLQLTLTLSGEVKPHLDTISKQPNVLVKSHSINTAELELQGNQTDQQQLLKALIMENIPVVSLQVQKQSMQDVYLGITKGQNKDPKKTKE
ncbi:MAG: ABC transporter ATP-binding protein [Candidatus Berkiella sp.]